MTDLEDEELAALAASGQRGCRAALEIQRRRASPPAFVAADVAELRAKLHAAHRELARRRRRDEELALHLPTVAARLQSLAADAALDLRGDAQPARSRGTDPEIDWTGIDGGDR